MINKEDYLKDPCGSMSIPYYKAKKTEVPENMIIINGSDFESGKIRIDHHAYMEELYFRLIYRLKDIPCVEVPQGFHLANISDDEFCEHINSCYENISISIGDISEIKESCVFDEELFIAVKDDISGEIVGSGIAVFDNEINEGVLEWIQVSENYRRKGIGEFIVRYLLHKLKDKADFVTVSGKVYNKNNPEKLYRKCGFEGDDVWHILWRK